MMYKLWHKDRHGREKFKIITEAKAKQLLDLKNNKESTFIPDIGILDYKDIKVTADQITTNVGFTTKEEKTRYETNPPTQEIWNYLTIGVIFNYPDLVPRIQKQEKTEGWTSIQEILPMILTGVYGSLCKSVWNWGNEKTKKILQDGKNLVQEGETFKSVLKNIAKIKRDQQKNMSKEFYQIEIMMLLSRTQKTGVPDPRVNSYGNILQAL